MQQYTSFILEQAKALLSINSPTGYTQKVSAYLMEEAARLGISAVQTVKGSVLFDLGGSDSDNAVFLEAHVDTLGAMVAEIKSNGRLRLDKLGGLNANNVEAENCTLYTRFGQEYEGTFQLCNPSIHVNLNYNDIARSFDTCELVLDEPVRSAAEVRALGIDVGDIVCPDPRTVITRSGYIKSRFLDDKLSASILLGYAKYLKESGILPARRIYMHFTVFEEVGHGGAASVPAGVTEAISVDMGCVGDGLQCTEHQVSICAKDSGGPYHELVTTGLVRAAREAGVDYAIDIYPRYGSDVESTLSAGHDVRHGLIGPGVYASHGYERSHTDGVVNTFRLLQAYLG